MAADSVVFRRRALWLFGIAALVGVALEAAYGSLMWPDPLPDRLGGGFVFGCFAMLFVRAGVWSAVVVTEECVTVRNLFFDYEIKGGGPELVSQPGRSPVMRVGFREIPVFAFSPSLFAQVLGDRTLDRLAKALRRRPRESTDAEVHVSRVRLLVQFLAIQSVFALLVLAGDLLVAR